MKFGKMKSHRRNRLLLVLFLVATVGGATTFTLLALNENINLFYSPAQINAGEAPINRRIRAGGMVREGSVKRSTSDLGVSFIISDLKNAQVTVEFEGILPDLFREGQGVITLGELNSDGVFIAEEVLAKHDENYMPPEVADVIADAHGEGQYSSGSYEATPEDEMPEMKKVEGI